jgi:hypothetical protein
LFRNITEIKQSGLEHHRNKAIWSGTTSITEMKPLVSEHHRIKTLWSGASAQLCSGTPEMKHFDPEQLFNCVPEQLQ